MSGPMYPNGATHPGAVKLMAQTNASARQARRRLELPKEGTAPLAASLAR